jgi:hypothetical protein
MTDALPETVEIAGVNMPIAWDFRVGVKYAELVRMGDLKAEDFLYELLKLYYSDFDSLDLVPAVVQELFERQQWFFLCGKPRPEKTKEDDTKAGAVISYELDAAYIYAAFLAQYGIDLSDTESMHWWKFRALFDGLTGDHQISKIMEIRGTDIRKVHASKRPLLRKQQQLYALPLGSDSERQRLSEIENILSGDGNLSKLFESGEKVNG